MQIIGNPTHVQHDPPYEILDGQSITYFEMPRRIAIIEAALADAGFGPPMPARSFGLEPIGAVHAQEYLDYLERAYRRWVASGRTPAAVIPSAIPLGGMRTRSTSPAAEAGRYAFDLSAPIVAGTYAAACGAADAALTGAAALHAGERAAYALCRPPGHHAGRAFAGGYCFLNNAAIAAHYLATADSAALPDDAPLPATWTMAAATVALLDIDFHHGNGTQDIFYQRSDVFFASIHADPDREYPYFLGFADERGAGPGEGYTMNIPLEAGVDDARYIVALEQSLEAIAAYSPRYLVISAGFDTFAGDPLGDFMLSTPVYAQIGARIAQLGLPTLFVQEGGYAVEQLGKNLVSLLGGFARR